jgi:hypothetical protein
MGCLTSQFTTTTAHHDEALDDIPADRSTAATTPRRAKSGFLGMKVRPARPARVNPPGGADRQPDQIEEPTQTVSAGAWLPHTPNPLASLPDEINLVPMKSPPPTKLLPLLPAPAKSSPTKPLPPPPNSPPPDFELRAALATIRELRASSRRFAQPHTSEARREWQREWNEVFGFWREVDADSKKGRVRG